MMPKADVSLDFSNPGHVSASHPTYSHILLLSVKWENIQTISHALEQMHVGVCLEKTVWFFWVHFNKL